MKGQWRSEQHCPKDQIPEYFSTLIDNVVYSFAKSAIQPEGWAENGVLYFVFVEDGLEVVKNPS